MSYNMIDTSQIPSSNTLVAQGDPTQRATDAPWKEASVLDRHGSAAGSGGGRGAREVRRSGQDISNAALRPLRHSLGTAAPSPLSADGYQALTLPHRHPAHCTDASCKTLQDLEKLKKLWPSALTHQTGHLLLQYQNLLPPASGPQNSHASLAGSPRQEI